MADGQHSATARVQVLLEFLNEREMDAEDLAEMRRVRLEQAAQLVQLQTDATHVANWIRNGEAMLLASLRVPENLQDAEQLRLEHEQFQVAIEKTHTSAVQVITDSVFILLYQFISLMHYYGVIINIRYAIIYRVFLGKT